MTSSSSRSASYRSLRMMGTRGSSWTWCSFTTHSKPPNRYFWAFLLLWQNWGEIKPEKKKNSQEKMEKYKIWCSSLIHRNVQRRWKENDENHFSKFPLKFQFSSHLSPKIKTAETLSHASFNLLAGSGVCTSWSGRGCSRWRAARWGWGGPWPSHPDALPPPRSPYQLRRWFHSPSFARGGKKTGLFFTNIYTSPHIPNNTTFSVKRNLMSILLNIHQYFIKHGDLKKHRKGRFKKHRYSF